MNVDLRHVTIPARRRLRKERKGNVVETRFSPVAAPASRPLSRPFSALELSGFYPCLTILPSRLTL